MASLSLILFGPMRVVLDGTPVTAFESDKVRALLAYLALETDQPLHRDVLATLLWPDRPEPNARRNFRQVLFGLRRALGDPSSDSPFVVVQQGMVHLDLSNDVTIDARECRTLADGCPHHSPPIPEVCDDCLERLQRATDLYRGSLLEGFTP